MSLTIDEYSIDIKQIIAFLEKLDVNDCIYYEYCKKMKLIYIRLIVILQI